MRDAVSLLLNIGLLSWFVGWVIDRLSAEGKEDMYREHIARGMEWAAEGDDAHPSS